MLGTPRPPDSCFASTHTGGGDEPAHRQILFEPPTTLTLKINKTITKNCSKGLNSAGQLGDNSTTQRTSPVDVVGLQSGVKAIASGPVSTHICAVLTAGGVRCWVS